MLELIGNNLLSPAILFFVLGVFAALVKSDLKFPQGLTDTLSIYLLLAIGLKGGIELSHHELGNLWSPILGTLFLGIVVPLLTYGICRWFRIDPIHAIALAATYGSVSIVTFAAAISYLEFVGLTSESYLTAMVVLLESPAIFLALVIYKTSLSRDKTPILAPTSSGFVSSVSKKFFSFISPTIWKESLFGKSILLMVGALLIGWLLGDKSLPVIKPLFIDLYKSILVVFLLGMGLVAGERLTQLKEYGFKLIGLAIAFPLLFGMLGLIVGKICGLSLGGILVMGVLGASSSYIAAPAALRQSIPEANPSVYIGMSLGVTFPFNIVIGLPLYQMIAQWLYTL